MRVEEHDQLSSYLASFNADENDMNGSDADFDSESEGLDLIVEEYADPLSSWLSSKEASDRECDSGNVFDESDDGFSSLESGDSTNPSEDDAEDYSDGHGQ